MSRGWSHDLHHQSLPTRPTCSGAGWVTGMRWDQIPTEAKLGALVAATVACLVATSGWVASSERSAVLRWGFGAAVVMLAGGVVGYAVVKLREAERRISKVQAREEVARSLHDGVLQTLAVVQQRATDPDLSRLAREQERELRELLSAMEAGGRRAEHTDASGRSPVRGTLRWSTQRGRGRRQR